MDPRHPEEAVSRMEELMEQFNETMRAIKVETVANKLGGLERKCSLLIQEICLVALTSRFLLFGFSFQSCHLCTPTASS